MNSIIETVRKGSIGGQEMTELDMLIKKSKTQGKKDLYKDKTAAEIIELVKGAQKSAENLAIDCEEEIYGQQGAA